MPGGRPPKSEKRKKQLALARLRKKQKAEAAKAAARLAARAASGHVVGPSDYGSDGRSDAARGGASETTEPTASVKDARRTKQAEARRKQRETIAARRSQPPTRASTRSVSRPRDFGAEQAAAAAETSDAHAKMWDTRRANEDARRRAELDSLRDRMEREHREKMRKMSAEAETLANARVEELDARARYIMACIGRQRQSEMMGKFGTCLHRGSDQRRLSESDPDPHRRLSPDSPILPVPGIEEQQGSIN